MIRFLLKSTNEYRYAVVGITYERRDRSGVNVSHLLIKKRRPSEASTMAEKDVKELIKPYRVKDGKGFRLKDIDPGDTGGLKSEQKKESREWLQHGVERLSQLQEKLYAQDRWALLLIIQAMDAAGKDGTIKHVMSGVNPQGCDVHPFNAPSSEELDHDYLWRAMKALPERGRIGIFNRSYYEEVLVVRVHPELLAAERLPDEALDEKNIWRDRYQSIHDFEAHLHRNGTQIVKFFLHVSKEEQRKRFLRRLEEPDKNWKFNRTDVEERKYWKDYMKAYEACLKATSTRDSPWYAVPADDKPNTWLIISQIILDTLRGLQMEYPRLDEEKRKELRLLRKMLEK